MAIVEHPRIHEVLGTFGGGDAFHRYRLGHIRLPVCYDEKLLVLPLHADQFTSDVYAH